MSIYENTGNMIAFCVLATVMGAVVGVFLDSTAWRLASGGKIVEEDRFFPHPQSSAVFSILTVLCLLRFDLSVICLRNLVFLCCLFCLALVDLRNYIIPDECLMISVAAWVAAIPFAFREYGGWISIFQNLLASVMYGGGMLVLSLAMDYILKKKSLGGGDIKLIAVIGLYLGKIASLFVLLFACVLGLLFVMIYGKSKKGTGEQIPFGPAIAAAGWLMLMYGSKLVVWYMVKI